MNYILNLFDHGFSFMLGKLFETRGSFEITEAFVQGYKTNIIMLSQQKGSRLENKVRNEMQNSESDFYERIGLVEASEISDRHGDTPITDTPHSRRRVTLTDVDFGDLIDKLDRVKLLINPDDAYVKAAVAAMGRKTDAQIIAAALGNAYSGKQGGTAVALPTTQKLAAHDGATTTGVGLNVQTLVACMEKFDDNDVDEDIPKYFAYGSKQKQDLLNTTEVTSQDFASVKALVEGKVDTFMGFKFCRLQLLPRSATNVTYTVTNGLVGAGTGTITASKSRRCIAWAEDGLLLAKGQDIVARIDERPDKRYSTQIYVAQSKGSTRLEEEKVVEVICSEN